MTFNEAFRFLRAKIGTWAVTYALVEARNTGKSKMYPYNITFSNDNLFTIQERKGVQS